MNKILRFTNPFCLYVVKKRKQQTAPNEDYTCYIGRRQSSLSLKYSKVIGHNPHGDSQHAPIDTIIYSKPN